MGREIVVDANVLVAQLDARDALAARATALAERLEQEGAELVLLDVLVNEAVSVLSRRARERASGAPDLRAVVAVVRGWAESNLIRWVAVEAERVFGDVLDVIDETGGRLNVNDALLVVLQREGVIGDVASFDGGFDAVPGFRRVS